MKALLLAFLFVALASACFDTITFNQCIDYCTYNDTCLAAKCYVWCSHKQQCPQAIEQQCELAVLSVGCSSNTDCNANYDSLFDICSQKPCPSNASCSNIGDGYLCHCPSGKYWNQTTNVCSASPCDGMICSGGYCITDDSLTPSCVCPGTKIWSATKNACVQGPCLNSNCPSESVCVFAGDAAYICECGQGFSWDSVSNACIVDPCLSNPCLDDASCENPFGYNQTPYLCFCPDLTQIYNYQSNQCESSTPCSNSNCPSNSVCNVVGGGFSCVCNSGYYVSFSNTCQSSSSTSLSIEATTTTSEYSSEANITLISYPSFGVTLNQNFPIGLTSLGPYSAGDLDYLTGVSVSVPANKKWILKELNLSFDSQVQYLVYYSTAIVGTVSVDFATFALSLGMQSGGMVDVNLQFQLNGDQSNSPWIQVPLSSVYPGQGIEFQLGLQVNIGNLTCISIKNLGSSSVPVAEIYAVSTLVSVAQSVPANKQIKVCV